MYDSHVLLKLRHAESRKLHHATDKDGICIDVSGNEYHTSEPRYANFPIIGSQTCRIEGLIGKQGE